MVVQPTEILDGAMVWRYWEPNYYLQNEMYIKELLNRHGKDLEFVGCVFANNVMRLDGKETMGMIGARLCRDTLRADCVVVNKSAWATRSSTPRSPSTGWRSSECPR